MITLNESTFESGVLEWLTNLGWQVGHGSTTASDTPRAEKDYNKRSL